MGDTDYVLVSEFFLGNNRYSTDKDMTTADKNSEQEIKRSQNVTSTQKIASV